MSKKVPTEAEAIKAHPWPSATEPEALSMECAQFLAATTKARRDAVASAKADAAKAGEPFDLKSVKPTIQEVSYQAWLRDTGGVEQVTKNNATKKAGGERKARSANALQYVHNGTPLPTAINYLSEVAARFSNKLVDGKPRLKTQEFVDFVKKHHKIDLSKREPFAEVDLGNGHRIAAVPFEGEVQRQPRAAKVAEKKAATSKPPRKSAAAKKAAPSKVTPEALAVAKATADRKAGRAPRSSAPTTPAKRNRKPAAAK